MSSETMKRRVYVLPAELVERLLAYQSNMGLQSEVEAARKLLDEALKRRDDCRTIVRRFVDQIGDKKSLSDIAGDVLLGHPLVKSMQFAEGHIGFSLETGEHITVRANGTYEMGRIEP